MAEVRAMGVQHEVMEVQFLIHPNSTVLVTRCMYRALTDPISTAGMFSSKEIFVAMYLIFQWLIQTDTGLKYPGTNRGVN